MRGRIEMQGVEDVGLTGDRIICGFVDVLIPALRADNDEVIWIDSPDRCDQLFGIGFDDRGPIGCVQRFIINLINDIGCMSL